MRPRKPAGPMTDATRAKIAAWWTPARRSARSRLYTGRKLSEATKQRIREWWTDDRRMLQAGRMTPDTLPSWPGEGND